MTAIPSMMKSVPEFEKLLKTEALQLYNRQIYSSVEEYTWCVPCATTVTGILRNLENPTAPVEIPGHKGHELNRRTRLVQWMGCTYEISIPGLLVMPSAEIRRATMLTKYAERMAKAFNYLVDVKMLNGSTLMQCAQMQLGSTGPKETWMLQLYVSSTYSMEELNRELGNHGFGRWFYHEGEVPQLRT